MNVKVSHQQQYSIIPLTSPHTGLILLISILASGCNELESDGSSGTDDQLTTIEYNGQSVTLLNNGQAVTDLSADAASRRYYRLDVPTAASDISFTVSSGSGDADLYVRIDALPDLDNYDCQSAQSGNEESCDTLRDSNIPYYIMLYGAADYSGVTLLASYTVSDSGGAGECVVSSVQQQLLDAHNTARAEARYCGSSYYPAVTALSWNCQLSAAAAAHNQDMVDNNFFSHTGSDGLQPSDRVQAAGYEYSYMGENIAAGYSSVTSVMNGWLDSPGHCSNIMNANYTEMGADRLTSSTADYSTYWTADFGRP